MVPVPVVEMMTDDEARVYQQKTGAERLKIVDMLYRSARRLIEANVRESHPEWDDLRVRRAVAERITGGTY
jgi:hypothetical protein